MRTLAVDWGEKRIGVAVSDPLGLTAQPLTILHQSPRKTPWDKLGEIIENYGITTVVVGIPFRSDGKESLKAEKVRSWILEAKKRFQSIHFEEMDERFTTVQAERILREKGMKAKEQKKHLDKTAAALILEQHLAIRSRPHE